MHVEKCQSYLDLAEAIEKMADKEANSRKLGHNSNRKDLIINIAPTKRVNRNPLSSLIILLI
jgi:hypothetical protein